MRIYLAGRIGIELGDRLIDERDLPGRQGRLAFALLAANRGRATPRDALADALWPEGLPNSWDIALSAILSNLRTVLARVGLDRSRVISTASGSCQLHLPVDTWVDLEAAARAVDEAEGALRRGDPMQAYGWAGVATAIARRPLLANESGAWLDLQRAELRGLLIRALDCCAEIFTWNGETTLAVEAAEETLTLEPYRETGYQRLMRVHAAAGNRAYALRTYERCRTLLAEELGVDPSPQTEAVYRQILSAGEQA